MRADGQRRLAAGESLDRRRRARAAPWLPKTASTRDPQAAGASGASLRRVAARAFRWAPSMPTACRCATRAATAAAATSVFPLPTSPCNSRFIGTSRVMSSQILESRAVARASAQTAATPSNSSEQARAVRATPARHDRVRAARGAAAPRWPAPRNSLKTKRSRARCASSGLRRRVHRSICVAQRQIAARLRDRGRERIVAGQLEQTRQISSCTTAAILRLARSLLAR